MQSASQHVLPTNKWAVGHIVMGYSIKDREHYYQITQLNDKIVYAQNMYVLRENNGAREFLPDRDDQPIAYPSRPNDKKSAVRMTIRDGYLTRHHVVYVKWQGTITKSKLDYLQAVSKEQQRGKLKSAGASAWQGMSKQQIASYLTDYARKHCCNYDASGLNRAQLLALIQKNNIPLPAKPIASSSTATVTFSSAEPKFLNNIDRARLQKLHALSQDENLLKETNMIYEDFTTDELREILEVYQKLQPRLKIRSNNRDSIVLALIKHQVVTEILQVYQQLPAWRIDQPPSKPSYLNGTVQRYCQEQVDNSTGLNGLTTYQMQRIVRRYNNMNQAAGLKSSSVRWRLAETIATNDLIGKLALIR